MCLSPSQAANRLGRREPLIKGQFQPDLRCLVEVEIMDGNGIFRRVHAKLDTAFTGEIALPSLDFASLEIATDGDQTVNLADGSQRRVQSCTAIVRLGEGEAEAKILNLLNTRQPLIGIGILLGYSIHIDALPYGDIRIERIQLK